MNIFLAIIFGAFASGFAGAVIKMAVALPSAQPEQRSLLSAGVIGGCGLIWLCVEAVTKLVAS